MRNLRSPSARPGLTPAEFLVGAAIVGLAVGIALPAVRKVRDAANRSKCQNNLGRIGTGLHEVHNAFGWFPPAGTGNPAPAETPAGWTFPPGAAADSQPATRGSHFHFLLPAVEQAALYYRTRSKAGGYTPNHNVPPPRVYLCPSDRTPWSASSRYFSNYAANVQLFGQGGMIRVPTFRRLSKPARVADGLSHTVAYAERSRVCPDPTGSAGRNVWTGMGAEITDPIFAWELDPVADTPPGNAGVGFPQFNVPLSLCDPTTTQAYHPAAMTVALADGSVRTIGPSVSPRAWQLALVPNDGDKTAADW